MIHNSPITSVGAFTYFQGKILERPSQRIKLYRVSLSEGREEEVERRGESVIGRKTCAIARSRTVNLSESSEIESLSILHADHPEITPMKSFGGRA